MLSVGTLGLSAVVAILSACNYGQVFAQDDGGIGGRDSSKLQVHIPHTLTKEGGYDHREALFGVPPYGGSLSQMIYYADSDLCEANVDTRAGFPIRDKDEDGNMKPWPSPYILMVDRGTCTFVQKVRNAQRSGASGVIIADNTCLCSAGDSCYSDPGEDCEPREPIMADDGSGADITIPSFLMFKQDADIIKAELKANHMVQIEMAWSLPSPDDRVEYELWTTPTDLVAKDFLRMFKQASDALGRRAYFTPHVYIYDGILSNCQGPDGQNQCYNLCTNNGRYCATDPDNNLDEGISGADVVVESLRRTCIWKHYGEEDGVGLPWWNYVNEFLNRCDTPDFFMNEDCIRDVYNIAGIQEKVINQCIVDSGGLDGDKKNTLLEEEIKGKEATGVVIIPAAFVNGAVIRGALNFRTVFQAVCAGYLEGTQPEICHKCSSCPDEYGCTVKGHCVGAVDQPASVSTPVFIGSLFAMAALFIIIGLIQYQKTKRQMRQQVRGIIAEYMPLDEDGKGEMPEMDTQIS